MKYCKKCNKPFEKNEDTYNDLCFSCYQDYLFDKIDNMETNKYTAKSNSENIFKKIINFLKNILKISKSK